jgi:hypothetical protein
MTTPVNDAGASAAAERAELGIRRAADVLGVDPRLLLGSQTAWTAVSAIDTQQVQDYDAAVAEAIRPVIDSNAAHFGVAPAAVQPPTSVQPVDDGPRQWTMDDVRAASPSETLAAMQSGLLSDLGMPARRRRR